MNHKLFFPLAAPLVLLGMLFTLLGSGMPVRAASAMLPPGVWNIEVIDNAGNVGEFSSLELDADDYPHVSYYDRTYGQLKYAHQDATGWHFETIDSGGTYSSLDLDGSGYAHIAYNSGGDIKYAYQDSSGWHTEMVDSQGGSWISLDLYGSTPHLSYVKSLLGLRNELYYAFRDTNGWARTLVDSGQTIQTFPVMPHGTSILVDSAGRPYITYSRVYQYRPSGSTPPNFFTWSNLELAYFDGTTWSRSILDGSTQSQRSKTKRGSFSSLVLDQNNTVRVSYTSETDSNGTGSLKYFSGSTRQFVDSTPSKYTSLALLPDMQPCITYYDQANQDLKFAYLDNNAWNIQTLDSQGDVGAYTSVEVDTQGYPFISYYDATNGDLKIAKYDKHGLFLTPALLSGSGALGEPVTYQLILLNNTDTSDSFYLELGSHTWETLPLTNPVGPVPSYGTAIITITVLVPADAVWYATDFMDVIARSQNDPTKTTNLARLNTQAYAPPQLNVSIASLASMQTTNQVITQSFTIGNGNAVPLNYQLSPFTRISFSAASKKLYFMDEWLGGLTIIATQDQTTVQVIDLNSGNVVAESPEMDRYETWFVNLVSGMYGKFKVESNHPVLGYNGFLNDYGTTTFYPSLGTGPVGTEFIIYYHCGDGAGDYCYVFATQDTTVQIFDSAGALVDSNSMNTGQYWVLSIPNGVYHIRSTGRIAIESSSEYGYTTVPSIDSNASGTLFYFATHAQDNGAFAVYAYQDTEVRVYDLSTGILRYNHALQRGEYWWQPDVGTSQLRLESTGLVEVLAGSTCGGSGIGDLKCDDFFTTGNAGKEFYIHSLGRGNIIYAPFENTTVDIDGITIHLDRDKTYSLDCCAFHHIQSDRPILVETRPYDGLLYNFGAYLGGVLDTPVPGDWLRVSPIEGSVPGSTTQGIQVTFDATGLRPGLYTRLMDLSTNDPLNPLVTIPVRMEVVELPNRVYVPLLNK